MELLVQIGEYRPGTDALADEAIRARPAMLEFLSQPPRTSLPFEQSLAALLRSAPRTGNAG
jgi:type III secretion protein N (ATPase)